MRAMALHQPQEYPRAKRIWRGLLYNLLTYVLWRPRITARLPWMSASLRTGAEDILGRRLFKRGLYEPGVTEFFLRYLSTAPQDVVYDVGANIGYYSILTQRVCGDGVPVHAIEAEAENHRQLVHNIERNGAKSVTPHHCALSDEVGEKTLHVWKRSNRGKHSLIPLDGTTKVTVKCSTLADLHRETGLEGRTISLLKIDIEGAEHAAFVGAGELLDRCSVILSELAPKFLARAGISIDEHLALMRGHGFVPFLIHRNKELVLMSDDDLRQKPNASDLAWVREDLLGEPWAKALFK